MRVIHACGMVEIARDLRFGAGFVAAARAALLAGRPILCDSQDGRARHHPRAPARRQRGRSARSTRPEVPALAARLGTTRSAAALDLWGERLAGALVAIGNAPTALFRLLELLDAGAPPPAAIIGMPVGFVGAAESKAALAADGRVPFLIVHGRRAAAPWRSRPSTRWRARRNDGRHAVCRRPRAGRPGADDAEGRADYRRRAGGRLLRQARPRRPCAQHRRRAACRRRRGTALRIPVHHRNRRRRSALRRRHGRVLR